MSTTPEARHSHDTEHEPVDPVEAVTHSIPFVLPAIAAGLMFLLAFIAVYMA